MTMKRWVLGMVCAGWLAAAASAADAAALQAAWQAAENAARERRFDAMFEHYRQALDLAPAGEKFRTQVKIAAALDRLDNATVRLRQVEAYGNALTLTADTKEKIDVLLKLSAAQRRAALPDEDLPLKTLRKALGLPDSTPEQKLSVYLALAKLHPDSDSFEKDCRQVAALPGLTADQQATALQALSDKHRTSWGSRDYPAAIGVLNEALAIPGLSLQKQIALLRQLAETRAAWGRGEEARQTYRQITRLPGASPQEIAGAWLSIAGSHLAPAKYMSPPSPDDYRAAVSCYREVLALEKVDTSAALAALAQAAVALGDSDQAVSSARQLLGNPKLNANMRNQALRLLGNIEREGEQFAAAFDRYQQAVQIENVGADHRILTLDRLVDMALTLRDYESAAKYLQALKDTPGRYADRNQLDRYLDNVRRLAAPAQR